MSALPVSPKRPKPTRIDRRMGTEESDSPGPILLPFLHLALRTRLKSAISRPRFGRPLRPDRDEPPLPLLNGQRERSGGRPAKSSRPPPCILKCRTAPLITPHFSCCSAGTARREPLGGNRFYCDWQRPAPAAFLSDLCPRRIFPYVCGKNRSAPCSFKAWLRFDKTLMNKSG